jgi:hypothetical protein
MHSPENEKQMYQEKIGFSRELVARFHDLSGIFDENLSENDEHVLPHNFISDVARYAVADFIASGKSDGQSGKYQQILDFLETSFGSENEATQELIIVSFLEILPRADKPGGEIRSCLGPKLTEALRAIDE